MRDKEVFQDYRFLPEPNLPPLRLIESCGACSSQSLPHKPQQAVCIGCVQRQHYADLVQLPNHLRRNLVFKHGLPLERASHLVDEPQLRSLYLLTSEVILSRLPRIEKEVLEVRQISIENLKAFVYREVAFWCSGLLYSNLHSIG